MSSGFLILKCIITVHFFEKSIKELYPDDWGQKLILITFISENGGAK